MDVSASAGDRTTKTRRRKATRRLSGAGAAAALALGLLLPIGVAAPAQAAGLATCSSFTWSGKNILGSCTNSKFQVMWQCWPSKKWNYKTLSGPLSFNFKACDVTWVTDAQPIR